MKKIVPFLKQLVRDPSLYSFLLIGLGNTAISLALQFLFYSHLHWGYWPSSALAFFLASISSFCLNRRYSFHSQGNVWVDALRFSINIAVCYLIAYGIAQPLTNWIVPLLGWPLLIRWQGELSLLAGNGLFTCLNYFGQRFFAFPNQRKSA